MSNANSRHGCCRARSCTSSFVVGSSNAAVAKSNAAERTRCSREPSARFGIDVLQPGMQYASVEMCPTLGGRVASFDAVEAQKLPGVKKVLAVPPLYGSTGGVAVIADTPYRAMRAVKAVRVEWDHGAAANLSTDVIYQRLAQSLDTDDGFSFHKHGDARAFLQLLEELTRRATDEEEDTLEDEFSLGEFLDRYGMRLAQLGNVLNVLGPLADAARASSPPQE